MKLAQTVSSSRITFILGWANCQMDQVLLDYGRYKIMYNFQDWSSSTKPSFLSKEFMEVQI